jgi:pimeloyl-ACP methyl ester carboxylesterase
MFLELAKKLSNIWIIVFRFDFSWYHESEWNFKKTTITKHKDDLSSILSFIKKQDEVDFLRMGILWQSFWTITAMVSEVKIKALVLMWSVAHPQKIVSSVFWKWYNPNWISKMIKKSWRVVELESDFWKDLNDYNLLKSIKEIKCPILFIYGSEDNIVPLSEMEELYKNTLSVKKKLIINWANHWLLPHRDIMYSNVIEWFKDKL